MPGRGKGVQSGEKRLIVRIFQYFDGDESKSRGNKGGQIKSPLQKTIAITGNVSVGSETISLKNVLSLGTHTKISIIMVNSLL